MWEMKSDLVPVSQLHTSKESTEDSISVPWSYRPLEIQETRWYWNKQPYSLKGTLALTHRGPQATFMQVQSLLLNGRLH